MNKVILMGRLTKDPEVRYSSSAEPVAIARYSLAINRRFKREGEPDADFINCVAFGKQGEFAEKYFKKGQMVAVCGRLQVSTYDDQNGVKRWSTDVVIEDQYFAESKASFEGRSQNDNYNFSQQPPNDFSAQSNRQSPAPSQSSEKKTAPDGFFSIDESLDDEDLPF